jgi:PAS domain S-box-containing protein
VGIACYLGYALGALLRYPDTGTVVLFPPYAVLVTALLLSPQRHWWAFLAAGLVAHIFSGFHERPLTWLLLADTANIARALVAVWGVRQFADQPARFDTLRNASVFIVFAVALAPVLAAVLGAGVVVSYDSAADYWRIWREWVLANALAALTMIPILVIVFTGQWRAIRKMPAARLVEAGILTTALVVIALAVFAGPTTGGISLAARLYAPLPFLLWAATRFGAAGASGGVLLISMSAMWGATRGHGPFAADMPSENMLALFQFLVAISVPLILLTALVQEREDALIAVQESLVDRRLAERALHDTRLVASLATSAARVGVWSLNLENEELYTDSVLPLMLGLNPEVRVTRTQWLDSIHQEDRERVVEGERAALAARPLHMADATDIPEIDYRVTDTSGHTKWMSTRATVLRHRDGTAYRIVGTAMDVTDRKAAEREAQEQRRQLAHLMRVATLGEIAGALAHEVRQPLTAILTNAQAALRFLTRVPPNLDEVTAALDEIVRNDKRAADVVQRLRVLLKRGEIEWQVVDLNELAQEVLDLDRSDLQARSVTVARQFARALPAIRGDRVQLHQVLLNLIINACEAMNENETAERQLLIATAQMDGFVALSVTDRGVGILPDAAAHLFEPFFTSKPQGLGLGLSICRTIVQDHGGRLWATNNADRGATFHLALPVFSPDLRRSG